MTNANISQHAKTQYIYLPGIFCEELVKELNIFKLQEVKDVSHQKMVELTQILSQILYVTLSPTPILCTPIYTAGARNWKLPFESSLTAGFWFVSSNGRILNEMKI